MFSWFQRQKQQDPKLTQAYEMGRKAAQSFADALDEVMEARFKPVHVALLGVIQDRYNECMSPTDAPPIIAARIEYKIFLDNIEEVRGKMTKEINSNLAEFLDVADHIEMRDEFQGLITAKVDSFCRELTDTALQRLLDMAHALKRTDDQWRTTNPELSAKFPPDE